MPIFDHAKREVQRLKTQKQRVGRVVVSQTDIEEVLRRFPIELREKVLKKGVRRATRVVANAARKRVPRSKSTGTRKLWSTQVKEQREGRGDLWKSIGTKLKQYNYGKTILGITGARRGGKAQHSGHHAHLVEFGGVFPRWSGNRYFMQGGGDRRSYQKPRPFLRPAAKETQAQQKREMVDRVKREWNKL